MRIETLILHPAAQYVALAFGLVLCLFLFWSLKRDLHAAEDRSKKKLASFEEELKAKAAALDERWTELSQISHLLVPPAPLRSGLNLTKRSQALQMIRRGESPRDIAATLGLPRSEVELLIKVHQLAQSAPNASAARAAGL